MDTSYLLDPSLQEELEAENVTVETDKPHETDIDLLVHFKKHPFHIDKESAEFLELVDSIRENGIIQPVLVRPLSMVNMRLFQDIVGPKLHVSLV